METLLHQHQRQLHALDDRLASWEVTVRALEAPDSRQRSLEPVLEALAALGARLNALEATVDALHARETDPAREETLEQAVEALGAHLATLEGAVSALQRAEQRQITETPRQQQVTTAGAGPSAPPGSAGTLAPAADAHLGEGAPAQRSADPPDPFAATLYVVQPGDTLWDLAVRFAVAPRRLIELNGLDAPDRLRPGQRLLIPTGAQPVLAP